jgi:hypothetical protein
VHIDIRSHLDLFDLDGALLLARLSRLFLRLVFVFAVVEDLADRRFRVGRDLYEVESRLYSARDSLAGRNDPDIVPRGVDELDGLIVDALVDTRSVPVWG